jgi:hypothetical protein
VVLWFLADMELNNAKIGVCECYKKKQIRVNKSVKITKKLTSKNQPKSQGV